ncbi:hypothetical protein OF83DRAFT_1294909 [Amylostereum chailletii]|nr:hypothetical protein OF83DRAFT_1294909 [Amylostereum chailletii]
MTFPLFSLDHKREQASDLSTSSRVFPKMPKLPNELLLDIFELATDVPHLLEIVPEIGDSYFLRDTDSDDILYEFVESLPTRHALTLVCRSFNILATPILYSCLLLSSISLPHLRGGINAHLASIVFHVVLNVHQIDPPTYHSILPSVFASLHNVQTLSMYRSFRIDTTEDHSTSLDLQTTQTMASSLGPTLRRFATYSPACSFFADPSFNMFTSSLVRLEALVAPTGRLSLGYSNHITSVQFPPSLPHLRYLSVLDTHFMPPAPLTPEFVRIQLIKSVTSLLSPMLTDLWLDITWCCDVDTYSSIAAACPNLIALKLYGGMLSKLVCLLTQHPFPPVSILYIETISDELSSLDPDSGEELWPIGLIQALVDALEALGAHAPMLESVKFEDDRFVENLGALVREGRVQISALEGCSFVVKDDDGNILLDLLREDGQQ